MALLLLVLAAAAPASIAAGASPGDALRARTQGLRGRDAELSTRERSAVLQLYSITSEASRVQTRLARLRSAADAVRAQERSAALRLHAARRTLEAAYGEMADQLRLLYERGDDGTPLAVVLGARSLQDVVDGLDEITRASEATHEVVVQTGAARTRVAALARRLRERRARLDALAADAQATASTLAARRTQREAYVAVLRTQRALTARQVAALEERASAADERARRLAEQRAREAAAQAAAAAQPAAHGVVAPAPEPPNTPAVAFAGATAPAQAAPVAGGATLAVSTTGYALRGTTATGLPVGWGVAAVDPAVIPLGTRMVIPGYGVAVAADTGPAVRGAEIDLWFPSNAQAAAWGRRSVTITIG